MTRTPKNHSRKSRHAQGNGGKSAHARRNRRSTQPMLGVTDNPPNPNPKGDDDGPPGEKEHGPRGH